MNSSNTKIEVFLDHKQIILMNPRGKTKTFPRCGITEIESFVDEMMRLGNLDDLIIDTW